MHFLTLVEEQSTMRNVPRILFVYTYSVYFRNFIYFVLKCATIFAIILHILLWLYVDVMFQAQTNIKTTFNGKPYESMFCSMYVVTSVTTSSLTQKNLIAMLFPLCCQVSTTCKHLCFPIIPKFKEIYNKKPRNRIQFCTILTNQPNIH